MLDCARFTGRKFTCSHYLMPVGDFQLSHTSGLAEFNKRLDWPGPGGFTAAGSAGNARPRTGRLNDLTLIIYLVFTLLI